MDLYAVLGLAPGASIADIKRAYRRSRGGITRDQSGGPYGGSVVPSHHRGVRDARRSRAAGAIRHAAATARRPAATTQSFEFAGFDFTVAAQGAQAATFTELFADVLHPVFPADAGKPEAGADLHATLAVSFHGRHARASSARSS